MQKFPVEGAMQTLPDSVKQYSHSPTFGPATMPAGLTHDHKTQPDVWARIVVLSGAVKYTVAEGQLPATATIWGRIWPAWSSR